MKNEQPNFSVGQMRMEYERDILIESKVPDHPLPLFDQWMAEAIERGQAEPHAMHLSTVGSDGFPAGRIVLLRGYDDWGLTFYTNYLSDKYRQLYTNLSDAATFFLLFIEIQIIITGLFSSVDDA